MANFASRRHGFVFCRDDFYRPFNFVSSTEIIMCVEKQQVRCSKWRISNYWYIAKQSHFMTGTALNPKTIFYGRARWAKLGDSFFCFSLTRASCMRPAGKKKRKKKTLSTRGCSFWVPLNTRGCLTRTPHGEKHTLNTRGCSFEYHWTREVPYTHATRCTQRYKSTSRTEKTSYTIPRCIIIHLVQMSDSVPFGVVYY